MSSGSTATTTVLLKKRERTQNWVPEEKNVLFSLIKSHANAIENKKIDAAASAMKTLAWQQIYRSFRARFSTERDITRMREQWRRMKAQARIEMYTFAEKVKTLGPEEATKSRPSNLSIEVWRLMERARKNEGEADRSDESSQDYQDNSRSLYAILDKLTSCALETTVREIKFERNQDTYNTHDEDSQNKSSHKKDNIVKKKRSRSHSVEPIDLGERKLLKISDTFQQLDNNVEESNDIHEDEVNVCSHLPDEENKSNTDRNTSFQNTIFIFEAARKEHDLKVKMLNIELERAELQKQTAINELKTSEMKRRLIEDQAVDYYSQIRMVGERGSGAGKGGGGGGSIREAGGSFGKMEAAHEDQYFYNQQKEQLQTLREGLHDEISFHEEQIKRHQEAINRHKKRITDMNSKE